MRSRLIVCSLGRVRQSRAELMQCARLGHRIRGIRKTGASIARTVGTKPNGGITQSAVATGVPGQLWRLSQETQSAVATGMTLSAGATGIILGARVEARTILRSACKSGTGRQVLGNAQMRI